MTVPFIVKHPDFPNIEIDANGEIEIGTPGGYYGDTVFSTFTAGELICIATFATRHQTAYQAYKDSDYEDEYAYFSVMEGATVIPA